MAIGRNFLVLTSFILSFVPFSYSLEQRLLVATSLERRAIQPVLSVTPLIHTARDPAASMIPVSVTSAAVNDQLAQRISKSDGVENFSLESSRAIVESLITEIDCRRQPVHSLDMRLKVTLTNAKGSDLNLNASYIGNVEGNARLRLTGLFNVLAMDVVQLGDRITCWMPLQKKAITGSRRELITDGQSELALLSAVGGVCELFFPRPWASEAVQRRAIFDGGQVVINVFGRSQTLGCGLRRFVLDPGQKTVATQDIFNSRNDSIGRIEYLEFCRLSTFIKQSSNLDKNVDGSALIPQTVRLANTNGRITLKLKVENIVVNQPLSADAFCIDFPRNQAIRDIGEMLKLGEPLFPR